MDDLETIRNIGDSDTNNVHIINYCACKKNSYENNTVVLIETCQNH